MRNTYDACLKGTIVTATRIITCFCFDEKAKTRCRTPPYLDELLLNRSGCLQRSHINSRFIDNLYLYPYGRKLPETSQSKQNHIDHFPYQMTALFQELNLGFRDDLKALKQKTNQVFDDDSVNNELARPIPAIQQ
jgi:hypothetical protein